MSKETTQVPVHNLYSESSPRQQVMYTPAQEKQQLFRELLEIQKNLSVPKGQYNKFGQYKFRSCEDILEAIKKITKLPVIIRDEITQIGERFYVKATASLVSFDGETIDCCAFAREPEDRKGMDSSQITGATSSYARKYALCALFAIDDTRDADHFSGNEPSELITNEQRETLNTMINTAQMSETKFCRSFGIQTVSELPSAKYKSAVARLNRRIDSSIDQDDTQS